MLCNAPHSLGYLVSFFSIHDLFYFYFQACLIATHIASCGSSLLAAIAALVLLILLSGIFIIRKQSEM
ncbi:hypothetical protein T4E_1788 [Trichinella pseudospiralis]|uniref:Uncharacterized protein n=1 Tax=Trichinella pseudospiralis TaxID=6337 RepID=A0A0V0XEN9_TRIPS|nr:hypothetical protein T4E_1788 [Trichinella pseudospiralis]